MAISSPQRIVTYEGDGVTATWPVPFRVLEKSHLVLTLIEGGDESSVSQGDFHATDLPANTSTLTYPLTDPLAAGQSLRIERIVPLMQPVSLQNQGGYFAGALEAAVDQVMMAVQQIDGGVSAGGSVVSVNGQVGVVTVTKADVGLASAENKSSATIRSEITSGNVTGALGFTPENFAKRGAANGYAPLGSDAKVPVGNLPAVVINDTFIVASQAAMLGLTAQRGDVAIRTDTNQSFVLATESPGTLADWKELLSPGDVAVAAKVAKAGDAMTGSLAINGAGKGLSASYYGDDTGMFAYSGNGRAANIGQNFGPDAGGVSVAKQTTGSQLAFSDVIYRFQTFAGATIGAAPTFAERLRWDASDDTWKFAGSGSFRGASSPTGTLSVTAGSGAARVFGVYGDGPASDTTALFTVERGGISRFWGAVRGVDPTASEHLVTRGWAEANLGGGGAPTGFHTVVASNDAGTIDLTGYAGRTIYLESDGLDDENVWVILGMLPGERATVKVAENFAFFTEPPDFYSGDCVIRGNWLAHETGHTSLAVGPRDTLEILCTATNEFEVWLSQNQFVSRASWPGSNREPTETYYSVGKISEQEPTAIDGLTDVLFGDFVTSVNGTSRKPTSGGHFFVGVGDTAGSFWSLYKSSDEDSEGLESLAHAVPHTELGVMSTHFATLMCKVYTPRDNGTLPTGHPWIGNFTMDMMRQPDLPPPGWTTGPGSILGQGWVAQSHFHHAEVPTRQSHAGGITHRVTPKGQSTLVVRHMVGHDGAVWSPGKASQEAAGTIAELAPFLDLSNIPQWNIPSLAWDILDDGYGNQTVLLTDAGDPDTDFFAGTAWRIWDDQISGADVFYRADENMIWFGSTGSTGRKRGFGHRPDHEGHFISAEGCADYSQVQGGRYFLANNGVQIIQLRAGQFGTLRIALSDGNYADYGVSSESSLTRLGFTTDATKFSVTNGTASKINVDISGGDLRIENKMGDASFVLDLRH